jgi:anaerobic magnesium-protoporphyrin IX monomethyl ester cyclase
MGNKGYYLSVFKGRRTLYLETSRGCTGKCTFCSNMIYNKRKWRVLSPENVLERIKFVYKKYGINNFYFIDDNFFVDLKRVRKIAEMIIAQSLDIIFEVQGIRYDSSIEIDDEFLELLYKSGLRKVHFGAESGSQRILDMVCKEITIDKIVNVNRQWSKYDIVVQHNFMAGFPTETIDDIKATINLIYKLKKENPRAMTSPICPYTPYPGTVLYQEALNDGFTERNKLEEWIESDYGDSIWISPSRNNLLKKIFFVTLFLESEREKDMLSSPVLKLGFGIYRKIANFRLKNFFFAFMIEITLKKIISLFYIKTRTHGGEGDESRV